MINFFNSPIAFVSWAAALLAALTIHEYAHAWMANHLGDPTPRLSGRLTLNPLAHLDPLGTLALLFFSFGWGKPVPVDQFNLKDPRKDYAYISLSGPASNFITAILSSLLLKSFYWFGLTQINFVAQIFPFVYVFFNMFIILNLGLGLFNLIPLPPLDGEKILLGFLPSNLALKVENTLEQYGLIILILLMFPIGTQQALVSTILSPIIGFLSNLLI
jgi:Zn-dependent protease